MMQKNYDHNACEDQLYQTWEQSGKMRADAHSAKKPFTIPLPPPNVTGQLHLGHAAMLAIEDILIRYKKMTNHEVCWLPGTDHAAIATENVVLKQLGAKSREEYSREEFLDHCRQFAGEKHDRIVAQMKKMGAWLDWSRESYTFDEPRNHAVIHMFKELYDAGLIERGYRMINWSAGAQSVISDDELEWDEIKEPFYYIQCGEFIIGTVRPETKCADSPVVVHPTGEYVRVRFRPSEPLTENRAQRIDSSDTTNHSLSQRENGRGIPSEKNPAHPLLKDGGEKIFILAKNLFEDEARRNKVLNLLPEGRFEVLETMTGNDLVGQSFEYETYAGKRKFYVLADEIIDMEKGSGSMTISTSHSADDYELANRLGLKETFISKIDFAGNMTDIAGPCAGMPVLKARKKSAQIMKDLGILVGEDTSYEHRVPKCYRSNCIIEPMISPQWFVMVEKKFTDKFTGKETTLKAQMQEAVRGGHVKIIPERFEKTYFQWIDNLRDWCISRQIWWGHQIPVWYDEANNVHLAEEKTVYLFRHGQSEDGKAGLVQHPDSPLTAEAKKNLLEQIADLKTKNITTIMTSSYKRAVETAEILAKAIGAEIIVTDELQGFGYGAKFFGQPKENVFGSNDNPADFAGFLANNELPETVPSFFTRLSKAWQNIKTIKTDGNILVVSHRTALSMLDLVLDGKKATDFAGARVGNTTRPAGTIWGERKIFCEPNIREQRPEKSEQKHTTVLWARHGQSESKEIFSTKPNQVLAMRHGQSVANVERDYLHVQSEHPLTELGREQVRAGAKKLAGRKIGAIIASPLKRTQETATIIAKEVGFNDKIITLPALIELGVGEHEGKKIVPPDNKCDLFRNHLPDGQSVEDLTNDAQKITEFVRNLEVDGDIILVSHFGRISSLLEYQKRGFIDSAFFEEMDDRYQIGNAGIIHLDLPTTPPDKGDSKGVLKKLRQEEDTLDTWFSSALWPISPLGYPNTNNPDFQKFYPSDVLETGWDIIFFWVARMIMFGRFATGKYPFHTVYLHGLVCDEKGKKMSKSKGNGIDPIEVIEEVGADAVRLSLVIGTTPGNNIPIGKNKIQGYRNFVNKLWNAGRFVQMQLDKEDEKGKTENGVGAQQFVPMVPKTLADKWILSRFSTVAAEVADALEKFQISTAGNAIYHFVWDEFCAWYLESLKAEPRPEFLVQLFREILKLTHPLCPYITEQLWEELFGENNNWVIDQAFPSIQFNDATAVKNYELVQTVVGSLRRLRADQGVNPKDTIPFQVTGDLDPAALKLIESLARVKTADNMPGNAVTFQESGINFSVDFPVDQAKQAKAKAELEKTIAGLKGRLANKKYVDNAPERLVEDTRNQLQEAEAKLAAMS